MERRLRRGAGGAGRAARIGSRDRADRDDPRRVRDGRDPLRAARPRRRAQCRALGLHLQHDQEVPDAARHGPARPRPGHDDRAVHARLHRAAGADLPSARRARDRRHGGVHPVSPRSGGQRAGAGGGARGQGTRIGRRVRRHLGRPSGPRAGRARDLRRGPRRAAEPEGSAAPGGPRHRRPTCSTSRVPGGAVTEAGVRANVVDRALRISPRGWPATARRRSTT